MAIAASAQSRWNQLVANRSGFVDRCERYAQYTLPKICPKEGFNQNADEQSHDFQAVGAQAVNHLANKIMLAQFAPSRPFFRLDASMEMKAMLAENGVKEDEIANMLAMGEKEAVKQLDRLALRPKLYEAIKHLIVTGNVLMYLDGDNMRVIGIKRYVVRRSISGEILEIMIADKVVFDELEPAVQAIASKRHTPDKEVVLFKWIKRDAHGDYHLTQWLGQDQLPAQFNGKWPKDALPFRVLTWDITDGQHYGTGLVEDYSRDFSGLSTLSLAQVQGAVLASQFRWLVNPAGMTRPEVFEQSENGAAIPGNEGDVTLVQSGKSGDLQITMDMAAEYINRIGKGFLLGSNIVRDAERVTAEEIRLVANELETALGGAYSRMAVDFQQPLARWLLSKLSIDTHGSGFEPTVITGLDALSRNGDLENLKLYLGDLGALQSLPPELLAKLNLETIANDLATARGIAAGKYVKPAQQIAQEQAQAREAQFQQDAANAALQAGAKQTGQQTA